MKNSALALAVVSGLAGVITPAAAEPFVFQGQLNDGGAPADGIYDLEFILFGDEIGGTQIGPTITLDDQEVINGGFLVELDFGEDAFDGGGRWIEISVRDGASGGGYTELAPRAKVGSAPQASYASKSGEASSLTNQFWTELAPGVLLVGEHEGSDQFFINHDRVIESSDVMVVHSAANAPGGMTMSTWRNGMPYYGYATGGFMQAKTYYDPITDSWVVSKGGDQLEIDENNDVIITNNLVVGGSITAMGGGDPSTGYKSYTPDSIYAGFDYNRSFDAFAGAIVPSGSTLYLRSDIDLPHNASITNITLEYADRTNASNLRVQLWRRELSSLAYVNETLGESTGANANMVQVMSIDPAQPIMIDNLTYTYALRIFATSGSWPANGLLGVRNIVITYTTP